MTTDRPVDRPVDRRALRAAGFALAAAGLAFVAVVGWLYGVLMPAGLDLEMFDAAPRLLDWLAAGHTGLYVTMYLIYLAQQVLLAAVPVLLWRGTGGGTAATVAAVWGTVSVVLAVLSIAQLVMATHAAQLAWAAAGTPAQQSLTVVVFDAGADLAKGARVVSEVFLGGWLAWLGVRLARAAGPVRPGWYLVTAVGGWTTAVGLWKLLDPFMPYEDWVAFLIGAAQAAAGVGLVRWAGRVAGPPQQDQARAALSAD